MEVTDPRSLSLKRIRPCYCTARINKANRFPKEPEVGLCVKCIEGFVADSAVPDVDRLAVRSAELLLQSGGEPDSSRGPTMNVVIQGDGVAARCCAYLLKKAGHRVRLERVDRPRLPVILLSEAALTLLRDLFDDRQLLRNLPAIRKRAVAWGRQPTAKVLEHSAVVVSEQVLLDSIGTGVYCDEWTEDKTDWTIVAGRPLRDGADERSIGSQTAFTVPVKLAIGSGAEACWIESLENGWLFLIPNAPTAGWLLSVGANPESLAASSRVIAEQISQITGAGREFLACPRITEPLCGEDWLACGSAAVSFDPICGDGTAYAAREAILASAIVQAAAEGVERKDLLAHYEDRVVRGFARHLGLCHELYRSGYGSPWWDLQVESIEIGLRWLRTRLEFQSRASFQLSGFRLTRLHKNEGRNS